jgi:NAD(P)-dependent dehydrogenase (short-subunit alcohol dehydrogenase family)
MDRLKDKVAVITGGASGMGRATAIRFAQEGAAVVIGDINRPAGEAVAKEIRSAEGRAVFQHADVSSEADIQNLVDRAVAEFGRLQIMFNNAGVAGAMGPIEKTSLEDWDRSFRVLLTSVFLGMKHSIPHIRKAGGGSIISTSSGAGLRAGIAPHAYTVAKSAIVMLTQNVALEVGPDKIRVNCICPGVINTPILSRHFPGGEQGVAKALSSLQPIGRVGTPDDIASTALFLASDESSFITGAMLLVDGGHLQTGIPELRGKAAPEPGYVGPSFER